MQSQQNPASVGMFFSWQSPPGCEKFGLKSEIESAEGPCRLEGEQRDFSCANSAVEINAFSESIQ
jgi:hypothetical protein